jgi:hypothetical protein
LIFFLLEQQEPQFFSVSVVLQQSHYLFCFIHLFFILFKAIFFLISWFIKLNNFAYFLSFYIRFRFE